MRTNRRAWTLWLWPVMVALVLAACGGAPERAGQPTVQVQVPESTDNMRVNSPVTVRVTASDEGGPGIVGVEMQVNDVTVDTMSSDEPTPTLTTNMSFTPTAEGVLSAKVVAIAADGVRSAPATFMLTIMSEAAGGEAGAAGAAASVEAQANAEVTIYAAPGVGCEVLGTWAAGDTGTLLAVNDDETDVWYQTSYLGEAQLGWVNVEGLALLSDDAALERVSAESCPYCGDGVVNQASEVCDKGGCAAGLVCTSDCTCVTLATSAPAEPTESPATCGNGVVEPGEACESNADCGGGVVCDACQCFGIVVN